MTFVEALGWAYVFAFLVWLTLRVFWFDAHWTLALVNDSALYLFAPLLFFLPYALWQEKYALLFALALPGVVFVIWYGARFLPHVQAQEHVAPRSLRVSSFNMHYENWNLDAFAQMILDARPDILGLQEVSEVNRAYIEERLAEYFPYRAYQPVREMHAVALLSRYPLTNVEFLTPTIERGLRATIHFADTQISVIVAHLAPPNMFTYPLSQFAPLARQRLETRRAETELLRRIGAEETGPAILLCDCNMSDTSKTYQTLASAWRDSFIERGWGPGHTLKIFSPIPLQRYDYIWHTDALRVETFTIGQDSGSDHLPVLATLHVP